MKPIALFSDSNMLPGLHVTLTTLLRSFSPEEAGEYRVFLFLDRVAEKEKKWIQETHELHTQGTQLEIQDYSAEAPKGGKLYFGSPTAYGRLSLPTLLTDYEKCIYLDIDLLVYRSLATLFDTIDENHVLVADGCGRRRGSVDEELFRAVGIDLDGRYFNSGVMGMNLKLWREQGISEKCNELSREYGHLFRSADQAILNTVLHDSFISVGPTWNYTVIPNSEKIKEIKKGMIYHFEHSPKPWDHTGRWLHRNYSLWKEVYRLTAVKDRPPRYYTSLYRIRKVLPAAWRELWRGKAVPSLEISAESIQKS